MFFREVGKTSLSLKYFSNADHKEKPNETTVSTTNKQGLNKAHDALITSNKDDFIKSQVNGHNKNNKINNNDHKAIEKNEKTSSNVCVHANLNTLQLNSCFSFDQYIPTTLSVYKCDIKINSVDYGLSLTDTSGCRHNKKFVQLRQHYYTITKVNLIIKIYF